MANTYKDIIITPNRSSNTADPNISFRGGNTASNTEIMLRVYPDANGTLSFEGSAGQLFSVTNDLTGTIFSVNDVSGIPSLEIDANGFVEIAAFGGNVGIGEANTSNISSKLYVAGNMNVTNSITTVNLTATTINAATVLTRTGINVSASAINAYNQANTATTVATAAYGQANLAYDRANTGVTVSTAAYGQANTATTVAQNAYGQANTARNTANSAYGQANTATTVAQNAYAQANTGATVTNDITTNSTYYIVFTSATTGAASQNVANTKLTFNPNTGTLSATIFNSISDREAKENIRDLGYGLNTVLSMEGKKFELKVSNETSIGFIAQDLEKIVPEVVLNHGDGYKGVNYGVIVAILVEAIKELTKRVEGLERK